MRRNRIAVVVPALDLGGGVPTVAAFVCRTIERSGMYDTKLISLATSASDETSLRISKPATWIRGVRMERGTWGTREFIHVGATAVELEFQRYRPRAVLNALLSDCDLIQVVCGSPAWAGAVCDVGRPVAVQCATRAVAERRRRDMTDRGGKAEWRRWMTRVTDRLDQRALRRVDAIQVENPWMLDYARRINRGREVMLRYAPPGVDAVRFHPTSEKGPGRDQYILCVGRLDDPRKNINQLIKAYALLSKELRTGTRLVLAGSAEPPISTWQLVKNLRLSDRVTFIHAPDADRLVRLYQEAAVFALPSAEEGLGMVILEAMACGLPVVATRCGGPEGIIEDGVDGFLVGIDSVAEMARKIADLLSDYQIRRRIGDAARLKVQNRFAEEVAGCVFLEIYDDLLRHKAVG